MLATVALATLTSLTHAEIAGTAIVTHVATGALASAAYLRSGQLREPLTRRTAALLAGAAVAGAPLGVWLNSVVDRAGFRIVLGVVLVAVGLLVWWREHPPAARQPRLPAWALAGVGFGVAAASGLVGVGGPMLAVPLLVALGVPLLPALGAAQVQSIVIAAAGTAGYVVRGAIDWPLAVLVGVPELAGVLLGWKLARSVSTGGLKVVLALALVALGPYVALG